MRRVHRQRLIRVGALVAVWALAAASATAAAPRRFDAGPATYAFDEGPGRTLVATAEVQGVLLAPASGGRHPVVVVEHGRHDSCVVDRPLSRAPWRCPPGQHEFGSFAGYGYLLRSLAARGFAVLSVDANAATIVEDGPAGSVFRRRVALALDDVSLRDGMAFRADVVDTLLERLALADAGGANPFGVPLAGRLDLGRVGLVGHSRGGEGVVAASLLGGRHRYRIRGVFVISPVDFERRTLDPHVAFGSLVSYCDGDVSDLEGLEYLDDARRTTRTAPLWQVVVAANHDFFNSRWPDEVDDADLGGPSGQARARALAPATYCACSLRDGGCGARPSSTSRASSSVRSWTAPSRGAPPRRACSAPRRSRRPRSPAPPSSRPTCRRRPRDSTCSPRARRATCTATSSAASRGRTGSRARRSAGRFAAASSTASSCRRRRRSTSASRRPARACRPRSRAACATCAGSARSRSARPSRRGRRTPRASSACPSSLTDAEGRTASVATRAREPALRYPPVGVSGVPNVVLGSVRVRLAAFRGVDRGRIASVALVFDRTPAGRLLVTDLSALR